MRFAQHLAIKTKAKSRQTAWLTMRHSTLRSAAALTISAPRSLISVMALRSIFTSRSSSILSDHIINDSMPFIHAVYIRFKLNVEMREIINYLWWNRNRILSAPSLMNLKSTMDLRASLLMVIMRSLDNKKVQILITQCQRGRHWEQGKINMNLQAICKITPFWSSNLSYHLPISQRLIAKVGGIYYFTICRFL